MRLRYLLLGVLLAALAALPAAAQTFIVPLQQKKPGQQGPLAYAPPIAPPQAAPFGGVAEPTGPSNVARQPSIGTSPEAAPFRY